MGLINNKFKMRKAAIFLVITLLGMLKAEEYVIPDYKPIDAVSYVVYDENGWQFEPFESIPK